MVLNMGEFTQRVMTSFGLGCLFWFSYFHLSAFSFSLILILILIHILLIEWQQLCMSTSPTFWIVTPLYPVFPFALLLNLNMNPLYHRLLFPLFLLVASHDTGSYIAGKLWGTTVIAPSISPKKSWQGFVGGYFGALFAAWFFDMMQPKISISQSCLIILFICLLSLIGDLFESYLKRIAEIKDTGSILPGHGGFLDRFDGILFAVLFFYWYKDYLLTIFT